MGFLDQRVREGPVPAYIRHCNVCSEVIQIIIIIADPIIMVLYALCGLSIHFAHAIYLLTLHTQQ